MSSGFIIVFGALAVGMLALSAHAATGEKNPWGFFAVTVGFSLALVGGSAWLAHSIWSWMLDTGLIVAFLLIAFGLACIWFFIGAVGAAVGLFQPRS